MDVMKKRILRGILALDGILLLLIVALFLADQLSGVPCGPRPHVAIPYFGCSRYALAALLLLGLLVDSMIVTLPLLLFALIQEVEAAL
jgi:hypothetical protein